MEEDAGNIAEVLDEIRRSEEEPDPSLLDRFRRIGPAAVPALIAYVTDPEEYNVWEDVGALGWGPYSAITLLGEMHPDEALQPLVSLLPWEDYDYLDVNRPRSVGTNRAHAGAAKNTKHAVAGKIVTCISPDNRTGQTCLERDGLPPAVTRRS